MAILLERTPPPGSRPLISGEPRLPTPDPTSIIQAAAATGLRELEKALASKMVGPWSQWKENVSVTWDGDGFVVGFHGTDDQIAAMENLEYGLDGRAPAPLVRMLMMEVPGILEKALSDAVTEEAGLVL